MIIPTKHFFSRRTATILIPLYMVILSGGCMHRIYTKEYNLDFEYAQSDSIPMQWTFANSTVTGYSAHLDRQVKQHGEASVRIQWDTVALFNRGGFQTFFPGEIASGKELEVRGWIKTQDLSEDGFAVLGLLAKTYLGKHRQQVDMENAVRGTTDWTCVSTKMQVDEGTDHIVISGIVIGRGTAWFDNLEIWIDGQKFEEKILQTPKTVLSLKDKKELKKYVYPLSSIDPDQEDMNDLDVLGRFIADSHLIGLGENTHGTSEVQKMKHRIFRYLVEKKGFNIFSLEAGMPECYRLNEYTAGGVGNPEQMIRDLNIWPWKTEEMRTMLEWMKNYNASESKITIMGVDMQYCYPIMRELVKRLEKCPGVLPTGREIAEKLDHININRWQLDQSLVKEIETDLAELASNPSISKLSAEERGWIQFYISTLQQFLSKTVDMFWRDRGMAANTLWIMKQHPASKVAIWAHNGHIGRKLNPNIGVIPMGKFLKEELGDDYLAIGFVSYEGEYTAWNGSELKSYALPQPKPGTLEYVLGQLDEPIFILDLKKMRSENSSVLHWIDNLEFRNIGASPEIYHDKKILETFDYLIFIQTTSSTHILKEVPENL